MELLIKGSNKNIQTAMEFLKQYCIDNLIPLVQINTHEKIYMGIPTTGEALEFNLDESFIKTNKTGNDWWLDKYNNNAGLWIGYQKIREGYIF